jgi:hypothetical protein
MSMQKEITTKIIRSNKKLMILAGDFTKFNMPLFAQEQNFYYIDFEDFLKENNIDHNYIQGKSERELQKISIDFAKWTQKIAYDKQKLVCIIDHFNVNKFENFLIKSLFNQEMVYHAKNDAKLKIKLVFVVDTSKKTLKKQLFPGILRNAEIITID